jgi:REP element-mobilizing transposase RayT
MKHRKITANRLDITKRRLPHWQIGGSWYFITFRTKGLMLSPEERSIAANTILHDHAKRYELAIAVVMPDHVHAIFRALQSGAGAYYSLTDILRLVKGVSARQMNLMSGSRRQIWQHESFDRIVRDADEWGEKYGYVRNNAVKAGLAETAEGYPWLLERDDFIKRW